MKLIGKILFISLLLASSSAEAISDRSFAAMYKSASDGDVAALRTAIHRGLRIDALNSRGETGICVAIKKSDYTAYNSFIAAGARANPACLRKISRVKYQKFMSSGKIAPSTRNQYTPPIGGGPEESSGGYVGPNQISVIQRELNYTAQTGNAYNLLYLPVNLLFSFVR